jgi:secondary thiamine-phosphate synthase enzyme
MVIQTDITLPAFPRGFHLITDIISEQLPDIPCNGIIHLMLKHTSAAITINENADPTVRSDFNNFFDKLVPDTIGYFEHIMEGSDDMPAHIKASLIGFSVTIPIRNHTLDLGTWQGIYLCEFRNHGGRRKITATMYS